jgi:general L-amino acid transport system substrate-binding protein
MMLALPLTAQAATPGPAGSATLDAVRARGKVVCGMQATNVPFSQPDQKSEWHGMDVDSCRALAAAILGDASKIQVSPVTGLTRFPAVQSGAIDVLFGSTTWITTRESSLGLLFAGANFYSGQGFLAHAKLGVTSAKELDGATICVPPGSTSEVILEDYFRKIGAKFTPIVIDDPNQIAASFLSGRCDVYTRDATGLAGFRSQQPKPTDFTLLPETISMEPLGAFVRKGDDRWFDIVRWVQFATIKAEYLGVTKANVAGMATSKNPDIKRLLGTEGDVGPSMGLDKLWAAHAIAAVGNYGEMWQRNAAPLDLKRGLNRLWNEGGLMYSPPLR